MTELTSLSSRRTTTGDKKLTITSAGDLIWTTDKPIQNTDPVLDVIDPITVEQNTDAVITLSATDFEDEQLTYSVTGGSNYTITNNVITFNSPTVGLHELTVTVTDQDGGSDSQLITITVTATPVNNPPTLQDQSVTAVVDVQKIIPLGPVADEDGHQITYTVEGSNDFIIDGNKITFNSSTEGVQVLSVTGTDSTGLEDTATLTVTVSAESSELIPNIIPIEDQFTPLGDTMTVTPQVSNPTSAGTVTWFKDFGPDEVVVDPLSGVITFDTTGRTLADSYHVGIKCENSQGVSHAVFIVHSGKTEQNVITIGPFETYKTWAEAHPHHSSGDTIIFENGSYSSDDNRIGRTVSEQTKYPASGTPVKMTTVMGRTPSKVTFNDGIAGVQFSLWAAGKNEASYITFSGLFFEGGSTLALVGDSGDKPNTRVHHIKVMYCGGNGENYIPLFTRIADYILFEGCYSFGGGRYKIATNEATNCIYRRCISRYDKSDRLPEENPKGSFIMYNVWGFRMDNNISIDDEDLFVNNGYKAGSFGTPVTYTGNTNLGSFGYVDQCLQLNCAQQLFQFDYQVNNGGGASDVEVTNVASYGNRSPSFYMYAWSFSLFKNCTFSFVRLEYAKEYLIQNGGYNNWRGFVNCVFDDIPAVTGAQYLCSSVTVGPASVPYAGSISRTVEKYGILDDNITNCEGMAIAKEGYGEDKVYNLTTTEPQMRYVTRMERGTPLHGTKGATVMTHRGRSGTFHGEEGYDVDTGLPMWPFPMEDAIRTKMREFSHTGATYSGENYLQRAIGPEDTLTGVRGFCGDDENLTSYVWAARGETPPPMNVKVVDGDEEATVLWELPRGLHATDVTGFTVYDYNPDDGSMSSPRNVSSDTNRITIPNLINGFEHPFVVTMTDSVKGESSYSYPTTAIPNGTPTVKPVIVSPPQSVSVVAGDTVIFNADVQGAETLFWVKDGEQIPDSNSEQLIVTAEVADDGAVYSIVGRNVVGDTASIGATTTITPLDSTAPNVSIAIANDTLSITTSDNLYSNEDLSVELLDGGSPTGDTWSGDTGSIDLTLTNLPTGTRTLSVRVTDPQDNVGTSNTLQYLVGSPVFVDDFTDTSNWSGPMTVENNVATLGGTVTGANDWWTAATKGSVKFDMMVMASANDYEGHVFEIGVTTGGNRVGSIRVFHYKFRTGNGNVSYYDRASGQSTAIGGSFNGIGGTYDFSSGQEEWREYEVIMVGTSLKIKAEGSEIFSGTLPESINPLSGTFKYEPYSSGDIKLRNFIAY